MIVVSPSKNFFLANIIIVKSLERLNKKSCLGFNIEFKQSKSTKCSH